MICRTITSAAYERPLWVISGPSALLLAQRLVSGVKRTFDHARKRSIEGPLSAKSGPSRDGRLKA